jgi:hypothetical protein
VQVTQAKSIKDIGDEDTSRIQLQVFAAGFSGDPALPLWTATIPKGNWQTVELVMPLGAAQHKVQIRPVNRPAVIEVSEISVSTDDGKAVWTVNTLPDLQALQTAGSISLLPGKGRCLFFSFKDDPLWLLPPVDTPGPSLRLKIVLCIHKDFEAVFGAFETSYAEFYKLAAEVRTASADRNQALRDYKRRAEAIAEDLDVALRKVEEQTKATEVVSQQANQLEEQKSFLEEQKNGLLSELDALRTEKNVLEEQKSFLEEQKNGLLSELDALRTEKNVLEEQKSFLEEQKNGLLSELDALRTEYQHVLQTHSAMESSLSWRITKPLRSASAFVRRL